MSDTENLAAGVRALQSLRAAKLLPNQAPPVVRTTQGDWQAGRWVPWHRLTREQQKTLWQHVRLGGQNPTNRLGFC